jgi:hypothetical protein
MERPDHPVAILDKILGPDSSKGIIGYAIPLICIVFLSIANIVVYQDDSRPGRGLALDKGKSNKPFSGPVHNNFVPGILASL